MSFGADVAKWAKDFEIGSEKVIKETAKEIFGSIVEDSPILSGQFVANWVLNDGNATFDKIVSTKGSKISALNAQIGALRSVDVLELSNPAPYGELLEFGYSDQAPIGMVRKNMMRWDMVMDQKAKVIFK